MKNYTRKLGRVFVLLDAQKFDQCFSDWAHSLPVLMAGEGEVTLFLLTL